MIFIMSRTMKERFNYRAEKSKKGSTYKDKKTGEVKEYSDFQRGVMVGRNKQAVEDNDIRILKEQGKEALREIKRERRENDPNTDKVYRAINRSTRKR